MKEWEEEIYTKKAPTAEDLQTIENEEMEDIIKDAENLGKEDNASEVVGSGIVLNKLELEAIDEMVRIIEDPTYISPVRIKRLAELGEYPDEEFEEISFGETGASSDDTMDFYQELHF